MIGRRDMTLSGLKPREDLTHGVPCDSIRDPRPAVARRAVPAHVLRIIQRLVQVMLDSERGVRSELGLEYVGPSTDNPRSCVPCGPSRALGRVVFGQFPVSPLPAELDLRDTSLREFARSLVRRESGSSKRIRSETALALYQEPSARAFGRLKTSKAAATSTRSRAAQRARGA